MAGKRRGSFTGKRKKRIGSNTLGGSFLGLGTAKSIVFSPKKSKVEDFETDEGDKRFKAAPEREREKEEKEEKKFRRSIGQSLCLRRFRRFYWTSSEN